HVPPVTHPRAEGEADRLVGDPRLLERLLIPVAPADLGCAIRPRREAKRHLRHLIELDLVSERIEHVGPTPARDRVRVLESRARPPQPGDGRVEVIDTEGEVTARVKPELAVLRQMHVTRARREPAPGPVA